MTTRRFVTAETCGDGVRTKVEDVSYDAEIPGIFGLTNIWGFDSTPTLPVRPEEISGEYVSMGLFPSSGGMRVALVTFEPMSSELSEGDEEIEGLDVGSGGNLVEHPSGNGMHRTDTVDLIVVLQGTINVAYPLDDGGEEEITLATGDFLVQNGAFHHWHNRSEESCSYIAFILPADRTA